MKTSPCKGCGKPIVWATSAESGALIPLDATAPIYVAYRSDDGGIYCVRSKALQLLETTAMVSHFSTCREANRFSRHKSHGSEHA